MEELITYLNNRIAELNKADVDFCEKRWDMERPEFERKVYREASNEVHARRMELETVLLFVNQRIKNDE